jgi:hypothetical protein
VRRKLVRDAQLVYEAEAGHCLQVSVHWSSELLPEKDEHKFLLRGLANTVTALVRKTEQVGHCCRVDNKGPADRTLEKCMEEISVFKIADRGRSCWNSSAGFCFGTPEVLVKRFRGLLATKESRIAEYLRTWSLLTKEFRMLCISGERVRSRSGEAERRSGTLPLDLPRFLLSLRPWKC